MNVVIGVVGLDTLVRQARPTVSGSPDTWLQGDIGPAGSQVDSWRANGQSAAVVRPRSPAACSSVAATLSSVPNIISVTKPTKIYGSADSPPPQRDRPCPGRCPCSRSCQRATEGLRPLATWRTKISAGAAGSQIPMTIAEVCALEPRPPPARSASPPGSMYSLKFIARRASQRNLRHERRAGVSGVELPPGRYRRVHYILDSTSFLFQGRVGRPGRPPYQYRSLA